MSKITFDIKELEHQYGLEMIATRVVDGQEEFVVVYDSITDKKEMKKRWEQILIDKLNE